MKYKLLFFLFTLTSTFYAQEPENFDLILDQNFDHHSDKVYTETLLKRDFDNVLPRTAGAIRGFGTNGTPQVTKIVDKKIRAHFRKNKVGGKEGGFLFDAIIDKTEEAYLEYDFSFDDQFVWALGGKLPGLGGSSKPLSSKGVIPSGCVSPSSTNQAEGFSCRLMWRTRRSVREENKKPYLVVYTYLPDREKRCGEDYRIFDDLEKGTTYKIKQYIKLNTPGRNNGILKMWVDTLEVLNETNVKFRNHSNVKIDALIGQTYRGGGADDLDWASPKENYAFFDNFKVWKRNNNPTNTTNQLPFADITLPNTDITITEGYDQLEVKVDASDNDGSIRKVDLYVNGNLLRSDTTSPYIFGRNNNELLGLNIGVNRLRAEVTDNNGGVTKKYRRITVQENIEVNTPPNVTITDPAQNITVQEGYNNLNLTVNANDTDGSIAKVDLFINGVFLRSITTAPYTFGANSELLNLDIGENIIKAVATDNDGDFTNKFRIITVEENPNQAPLVSFTNPSQNLTLEFGYEALEVSVNATDNDGEISKVELYVDDLLINTQRSAPYTFGRNNNQLLGLAVGNHTFKAIATDNQNLTAETTFILTVKSKPNLSFININDELTLIEGYDTFKVSVNATDTHENITEVRLYLNNELIRTERVAPYDWGHDVNETISSELLNIPVGQHIIKATAVNAANIENSNSFVLNITQNSTLSLGDNFKKNTKLSIYPNPVVNHNLNITGLPNSKHNINIYNFNGQKVLTIKSNKPSIKINTSNMPTGAYIIRIDKTNQSKVFIIE